MTDGAVTQKTKYHCIASEHEGPMQADELRVFYGQLWCSECWYTHSKAGKRWDELYRFADVQVAEQEPVAWALMMKGGKVADAFADRALAEFVAGFAVHKLVPLYLHPQPAPDVAVLVEALNVVKAVLESDDPAIADTVWVPGAPETLLDHVCAALAAYRQSGGES